MRRDVALYLAILRRSARLILVCGLVALLGSVAALLVERVPYQTQLRLLVTRADDAAPGFAATPAGEDRAAQDIPAVIAGEPFRQDVQSRVGAQTAVAADALTAEVAGRSVLITVRAADAAGANAIAAAVPELLRTNGLRYWGDPQAQPGNGGLNIAVLSAPAPASAGRSLTQRLLTIGLRTVVGLALGAGAALALHALGWGTSPRRTQATKATKP